MGPGWPGWSPYSISYSRLLCLTSWVQQSWGLPMVQWTLSLILSSLNQFFSEWLLPDLWDTVVGKSYWKCFSCLNSVGGQGGPSRYWVGSPGNCLKRLNWEHCSSVKHSPNSGPVIPAPSGTYSGNSSPTGPSTSKN